MAAHLLEYAGDGEREGGSVGHQQELGCLHTCGRQNLTEASPIKYVCTLSCRGGKMSSKIGNTVQTPLE